MSTALATKIITTGTVIGAIVAGLSAWGTYGWVTRDAYAKDHEGASVETQQIAILKALDVIQAGQKELRAAQDRNQDQWECDETDEELKELLDKKDKANGYLSPTDLRQESKLEEVWLDKRCKRFTD